MQQNNCCCFWLFFRSNGRPTQINEMETGDFSINRLFRFCSNKHKVNNESRAKTDMHKCIFGAQSGCEVLHRIGIYHNTEELLSRCALIWNISFMCMRPIGRNKSYTIYHICIQRIFHDDGIGLGMERDNALAPFSLAALPSLLPLEHGNMYHRKYFASKKIIYYRVEKTILTFFLTLPPSSFLQSLWK